MIVRWRKPATADLFRIVDYIAQQNPAAAQRVAEDLLLAGESLAVFPRRGRKGASGTRELVVMDDRVLILRVWHAAQDRP